MLLQHFSVVETEEVNEVRFRADAGASLSESCSCVGFYDLAYKDLDDVCLERLRELEIGWDFSYCKSRGKSSGYYVMVSIHVVVPPCSLFVV